MKNLNMQKIGRTNVISKRKTLGNFAISADIREIVNKPRNTVTKKPAR
jgi:hypothetical protein